MKLCQYCGYYFVGNPCPYCEIIYKEIKEKYMCGCDNKELRYHLIFINQRGDLERDIYEKKEHLDSRLKREDIKKYQSSFEHIRLIGDFTIIKGYDVKCEQQNWKIYD